MNADTGAPEALIPSPPIVPPKPQVRYAVLTLADGTEVERRRPARLGRKERRTMLYAARRAVKRLASMPRGRLVQLSASRRDEWREMKAPVPTRSDGWVMRTLGFLFLWGEGENLISGIRGIGNPLKGVSPNPIETPVPVKDESEVLA